MTDPTEWAPELLTMIQAARQAPASDRDRLMRRAEEFVRRLMPDRPAPACEGKPWVHTYTHGERGE